MEKAVVHGQGKARLEESADVLIKLEIDSKVVSY